jgi:hypothetical protein
LAFFLWLLSSSQNYVEGTECQKQQQLQISFCATQPSFQILDIIRRKLKFPTLHKAWKTISPFDPPSFAIVKRHTYSPTSQKTSQIEKKLPIIKKVKKRIYSAIYFLAGLRPKRGKYIFLLVWLYEEQFPKIVFTSIPVQIENRCERLVCTEW